MLYEHHDVFHVYRLLSITALYSIGWSFVPMDPSSGVVKITHQKRH